jgi:AcrR family transcriptional regulator
MHEKEGARAWFQGRPRSECARRAILEAAVRLVERDGFSAVTVEAIAKRAGVSKATIYRWWPNKAAIVTDGFLKLNAPNVLFSVDTGSVWEDLRLQMGGLARVLGSDEGKVIAALYVESQSNSEVAEALRTGWIFARRESTKKTLQRGIVRGELRADFDLEAAMDALFGPIYYRMLGGYAPLDESFVEALANCVLLGLSTLDESNGTSDD